MSATTDKKISGVKVWLDKELLQKTKGGGELLTLFEKYNVPTIIEQLPVSDSIFWTRSASNGSADDVQHHHILIKLENSAFIEYLLDYSNPEITNPKLKLFLSEIKTKAVTDITFLISNFKQYYKTLQNSKSDMKAREDYKSLLAKQTKQKQQTKLTKSDVQRCLIQLEIEENVSVRSYETVEDLKDLILSYTKSISEYTSKKDGSDLLIFCDKAVEKSQSKVGKDSHGLIQLYKDLISEFPLVSSDQAQAICSAYPAPFLLKKV
jgi:hypothetical protein